MIAITDGGRPVPHPAGRRRDVLRQRTSSRPSARRRRPSVFYVRDGGVVDAAGRPCPGRSAPTLRPVLGGARPRSGPADLRVAGVSGCRRANAQLLVGTGAPACTRPRARRAVAPGVGARTRRGLGRRRGRRCIGVPAPDGRRTPVAATRPAGRSGTIAALRFSPEGSRIAMVIAAARRQFAGVDRARCAQRGRRCGSTVSSRSARRASRHRRGLERPAEVVRRSAVASTGDTASTRCRSTARCGRHAPSGLPQTAGQHHRRREPGRLGVRRGRSGCSGPARWQPGRAGTTTGTSTRST